MHLSILSAYLAVVLLLYGLEMKRSASYVTYWDLNDVCQPLPTVSDSLTFQQRLFRNRLSKDEPCIYDLYSRFPPHLQIQFLNLKYSRHLENYGK